jgi:hypothetical protein
MLATAVRHRFGFVEHMSDSSILYGAVVGNTNSLGKWLDELNASIARGLPFSEAA